METTDERPFVGGTDIAKILGLSPWGGPVDCWLDKINYQPRPVHDAARKDVLRRGKRLERYIADLITEEFGILCKNPNARHHDAEVAYFAAEVDFEYFDEETGQIENGEIKTVHPFKSREWGEEETDELPLHYIAQNQWGLGVTRRRRCRTFALIGDELKPYLVERDELIIEAMRDKARDFWASYVVPVVRPPMVFEDERSIELVRRMYPGTDGRELQAADEDERWRSVLQDAQVRADKYLNVVAGAKAHLLDRMGSAALLKFADGSALRRKLIKVAGYTVEPRQQIDSRFLKAKG